MNAWKCRLKKENAIEELKKKLKETAIHYRKLTGKRLESYSLNADKNLDSTIKEIYDIFKKAWIKLDGVKVKGKSFGGTAASKIMHILNQDLFVMWDNNIRLAYEIGESSDDYLTFLDRMADIAREVKPYYRELNEIYYHKKSKSLPKLLDEYFYSKYTIVLPKKEQYVNAIWPENEDILTRILKENPFDEIASLIENGRRK